MSNKVRSLRKKKGLTQAGLAAKAGTSQQQIQRIEAGQAARFDLALRICEALDVPVELLFPETKPILAKLRKSSKDVSQALRKDQDAQEAMGKAGIDMDPVQWTLKFRTKNGMVRSYPVSSPDKARLWHYIQQVDSSRGTQFFVFDSEDLTVGINLNRLAYVHFLFDAPYSAEEVEGAGGISIFFEDATTPEIFGVDPDEPQDEDDDDADIQNVQNIVLTLDGEPEPDQFIEFTDSDGEVVWFRAASVSLIEISNWALGHGSEDDDLDQVDDEASANKPSTEA